MRWATVSRGSGAAAVGMAGVAVFVDSMIATIDAILEASGWGSGPDALTPEHQAQITKLAEKQLRLIVLAIPHWQSRP